MKKTQRVQTILEILKRWGRLDKKTIDSHFVTISNQELTPALKRAIYRDLDELVNHNKLNIEYFHRDRTPIAEYNPVIHKNVISEWSLVGSENKIVGQDILDQLNAQLYVPKLIKNDVSINKGDSPLTHNYLNLYFEISGAFLCLNISSDSIPIKVHISRKANNISKNEIKYFEQTFGYRAMMLKVPNSQVSSFDYLNNKSGHLILEINENEVTLQDLKSSNGSKLIPIRDEDCEDLIKNGALLGNQTSRGNWTELPSNLPIKKIEKLIAQEPPFIVNLADDFIFLLKK